MNAQTKVELLEQDSWGLRKIFFSHHYYDSIRSTTPDHPNAPLPTNTAYTTYVKGYPYKRLVRETRRYLGFPLALICPWFLQFAGKSISFTLFNVGFALYFVYESLANLFYQRVSPRQELIRLALFAIGIAIAISLAFSIAPAGYFTVMLVNYIAAAINGISCLCRLFLPHLDQLIASIWQQKQLEPGDVGFLTDCERQCPAYYKFDLQRDRVVCQRIRVATSEQLSEVNQAIGFAHYVLQSYRGHGLLRSEPEVKAWSIAIKCFKETGNPVLLIGLLEDMHTQELGQYDYHRQRLVDYERQVGALSVTQKQEFERQAQQRQVRLQLLHQLSTRLSAIGRELEHELATEPATMAVDVSAQSQFGNLFRDMALKPDLAKDQHVFVSSDAEAVGLLRALRRFPARFLMMVSPYVLLYFYRSLLVTVFNIAFAAYFLSEPLMQLLYYRIERTEALIRLVLVGLAIAAVMLCIPAAISTSPINHTLLLLNWIAVSITSASYCGRFLAPTLHRLFDRLLNFFGFSTASQLPALFRFDPQADGLVLQLLAKKDLSLEQADDLLAFLYDRIRSLQQAPFGAILHAKQIQLYFRCASELKSGQPQFALAAVADYHGLKLAQYKTIHSVLGQIRTLFRQLGDARQRSQALATQNRILELVASISTLDVNAAKQRLVSQGLSEQQAVECIVAYTEALLLEPEQSSGIESTSVARRQVQALRAKLRQLARLKPQPDRQDKETSPNEQDILGSRGELGDVILDKMPNLIRGIPSIYSELTGSPQIYDAASAGSQPEATGAFRLRVQLPLRWNTQLESYAASLNKPPETIIMRSLQRYLMPLAISVTSVFLQLTAANVIFTAFNLAFAASFVAEMMHDCFAARVNPGVHLARLLIVAVVTVLALPFLTSVTATGSLFYLMALNVVASVVNIASYASELLLLAIEPRLRLLAQSVGLTNTLGALALDEVADAVVIHRLQQSECSKQHAERVIAHLHSEVLRYQRWFGGVFYRARIKELEEAIDQIKSNGSMAAAVKLLRRQFDVAVARHAYNRKSLTSIIDMLDQLQTAEAPAQPYISEQFPLPCHALALDESAIVAARVPANPGERSQTYRQLYAVLVDVLDDATCKRQLPELPATEHLSQPVQRRLLSVASKASRCLEREVVANRDVAINLGQLFFELDKGGDKPEALHHQGQTSALA